VKTTIDLPENIVRGLKLRALQDGKTLQALAAELLRMTPARSPSARAQGRIVAKNLPVIAARPLAKAKPKPMTAQQMSDWLKQADLDLEAEHHEEIARR
jgi:hypothetical protein